MTVPVAEIVPDAEVVAEVIVEAPTSDPRKAPKEFQIAFDRVKVLPAYWNQDEEAVKRAVRDWQDKGIVPNGVV